MERLFDFLLLVHIAAGMTCLITGVLAIAARKGGKTHIYAGKTYFIAMTTVIITAVIVALHRGNIFLLLIASFSFYMAWAGNRSIKNKSLRPSLLDWILLFIAATTSFFMIYTMNVVLLIFGGLFAVNIIQETLLFLQARKKDFHSGRKWLTRHIGMMLGSFIATCTAFLVTNVHNVEPAWLLWIAPTIVGTPLIAIYTRKSLKN